jgi:hypothetical protein
MNVTFMVVAFVILIVRPVSLCGSLLERDSLESSLSDSRGSKRAPGSRGFFPLRRGNFPSHALTLPRDIACLRSCSAGHRA